MASNPKDVPQHYYSLEEYFALEDASDARFEYWDGDIVCMSGGSRAHGTISSNVSFALAFFLVTRGASDVEDAAFDAAESLTRDDAAGARGGDEFLRGAHALDSRRQSDLLCWLYARDEEKYKFLIEEGELPAERAARCPEEFAQVEREWSERLKQYLKTR